MQKETQIGNTEWSNLTSDGVEDGVDRSEEEGVDASDKKHPHKQSRRLGQEPKTRADARPREKVRDDRDRCRNDAAVEGLGLGIQDLGRDRCCNDAAVEG